MIKWLLLLFYFGSVLMTSACATAPAQPRTPAAEKFDLAHPDQIVFEFKEAGALSLSNNSLKFSWVNAQKQNKLIFTLAHNCIC